ncbi:MAG: T9SS type A sorting domain-containing protein [Bacteroidota bacterium]
MSLGLIVPSNCGSDNLGAKFVMGPYTCQSLVTNSASIYTDSIITDSTGWTRIFGSFIADSTYNYVVLGNFFDDANTDTVRFYNDSQDNAYYFLDDVCVSTDSVYAYNYFYTSLSENNSPFQILFYPNPVTTHLFIETLSEQIADVEICNLIGERLFFAKQVSLRRLTIDTANFGAGFLLVKIKTEKQIFIYKLLKP